MNPTAARDTRSSTRKKFDKLRGWMRSEVRLFLHGLWWGLLWKLRLGKPYSRFMCRRGWYRKFYDGRCMYCGNNH